MKHFYANVTEVGKDQFCGCCREKLKQELNCSYCGARTDYDSVIKNIKLDNNYYKSAMRHILID